MLQGYDTNRDFRIFIVTTMVTKIDLRIRVRSTSKDALNVSVGTCRLIAMYDKTGLFVESECKRCTYIYTHLYLYLLIHLNTLMFEIQLA